jgi:hypothetical protein
VYAHLLHWMTYTPEFQLMIMLISSPLALIVALRVTGIRGMTSKATLQLMKSRKRESQLSLKPVKTVLQK